MSTVVETVRAINRLTQDEDEQQELWVYYLQSGDDDAFSAHLAEIQEINREAHLLQVALWTRVSECCRPVLPDLLDKFTDLEQSVMCLLALGATLEEIGSIISVGATRLRHVISVIREHEVWTRR